MRPSGGRLVRAWAATWFVRGGQPGEAGARKIGAWFRWHSLSRLCEAPTTMCCGLPRLHRLETLCHRAARNLAPFLPNSACSQARPQAAAKPAKDRSGPVETVPEPAQTAFQSCPIVQNGSEWYRTVQNGTERYRMVQNGSEWYRTVQFGTASVSPQQHVIKGVIEEMAMFADANNNVGSGKLSARTASQQPSANKCPMPQSPCGWTSR